MVCVLINTRSSAACRELGRTGNGRDRNSKTAQSRLSLASPPELRHTTRGSDITEPSNAGSILFNGWHVSRYELSTGYVPRRVNREP